MSAATWANDKAAIEQLEFGAVAAIRSDSTLATEYFCRVQTLSVHFKNTKFANLVPITIRF